MKEAPESSPPDTTHKIWVDEWRLFDKARIDGWREVITTDADERRYEARVSSPCSPDLAAWFLGGSLAS